MIRAVAAKELLTCLLTWRFALALMASVLLMAASAAVLRVDYAKRLDDHAAELAKIQADLQDVKVYAQLEVTTSRPPSPLSVFSEGLEKRLGTILRFSYAKVPTLLTWRKETNPLLAAFPPFDLATIAQLLFSLVALFFAFDAVSGEREGNTLRLVAANRIARWQIVIGKWLGGGACSLLPATVGFLVATAVVVASPQIVLDGARWLRVALILGAVLLYTSAFYLLGLCLSTVCRHSRTALAAAIAVWAGCTVVAPALTSYLVGQLVPLPPARQLEARWEDMETRFAQDYWDEYHAAQDDFVRQVGGDFPFFSFTTRYQRAPVGRVVIPVGPSREAVPFLTAFNSRLEVRRVDLGEKIAGLEDRLVDARAAQVEWDRALGRPFLAPAFRGAVSALAATDLASFLDFIAFARRHQRQLLASMRGQGLFSSLRFFCPTDEDELVSHQDQERRYQDGMGRADLRSSPPLDVPDLPDYRPSVTGVLGGAAGDLAVLAGANGLLLFTSLWAFARRELV